MGHALRIEHYDLDARRRDGRPWRKHRVGDDLYPFGDCVVDELESMCTCGRGARSADGRVALRLVLEGRDEEDRAQRDRSGNGAGSMCRPTPAADQGGEYEQLVANGRSHRIFACGAARAPRDTG